MTILDLQRKLDEGSKKASPALKHLMAKMKDLPFYHPTKKSFWSEIIPPLRYDGTPSPLWDYQQKIVEALQNKRIVAVNKCRNSGLTELGLRFILYKILCEQIPGNYIGIAATNLDLSKDLARRMKAILEPHHVYFTDDRETVLTFPHARVQFHPSSAENIRGYIPSFCMIDEFSVPDFGSEIFASVDAFYLKNPNICQIYAISTPGRVGSAGHQLWAQKNSMYERITVNWRDCINKTFSQETLDLLKSSSPSFEQEFNNRFGFSAEGNTFRAEAIDAAICKDSLQLNGFSNVYMGWDVGFSANSAGCVGQLSDGFFEVLHAKEYEQKDPDFQSMVDECASLINEYGVTKCWIDGSAPSFITAVRERTGEERDYNAVIDRNKHNKIPWDSGMRVCPIAFNKFGRDMLFTAKTALEKGGIIIPADKSELIEFLRTAKDSDGHLNKKITSYHHVGDSFLLALRGVEIEAEGGGE